MKSWSDRQVFFVFDNEYCQNEEDDPKDAIIYFYPHDTTDNVRCTLCCQLMGMCRFMASCFSPVSLIRLDKGKFAIRTMDKYTLGLKGNPDMPDSVLQRQLLYLIRLFVFYYKDFDNVLKLMDGKRSDFVVYMNLIWNHLLSISQHGGNTLSVTFEVIPSIKLPKTAGLLFLQTSQMLQACQRIRGVYGGCLFCERRVFYSQLSTKILSKLSFIWQKQVVPGDNLKVNFELPNGINLVPIFLTQNEQYELNFMNMDGNLMNLNCPSPSRPSTSTSSPNSSDLTDDISSVRCSSGVTKSCTDESLKYPSEGTPLTDYTETTVNSDAETLSELLHLQPATLYIQECGDTVLVLILDIHCKDNSSIIFELWKQCQEIILSLGTDVNACLESSSKPKEYATELKYLYLHFDKIWQRAQGNSIFPETTMEQQIFNQSAQLLHEEFAKEPHLHETTIRVQDLVIYSHLLGSKETFFYTNSSRKHLFNNTNSSKQGCTGFPFQSDLTAQISYKAKRKLLHEQRLVLL